MSSLNIRVGQGYDAHRFDANRPLILGGVKVPYEKGLLGHSDADVLLHAIMDAMLGAAGLGDIGRHFPDSDAAFKGVSSLRLLEKTMGLIRKEGWEVSNIDATVVAEKPKLAPYMAEMKTRVAEVLGLYEPAVNIKATTEEGMGFTGRGEGIAAYAVCLIAGANMA